MCRVLAIELASTHAETLVLFRPKDTRDLRLMPPVSNAAEHPSARKCRLNKACASAAPTSFRADGSSSCSRLVSGNIVSNGNSNSRFKDQCATVLSLKNFLLEFHFQVNFAALCLSKLYVIRLMMITFFSKEWGIDLTNPHLTCRMGI